MKLFHVVVAAGLVMTAACAGRPAAGQDSKKEDGCWKERPCPREEGSTFECFTPDTPRLCGPAMCDVAQRMCSEDHACREGYVCAADPGQGGMMLCSPAPCEGDASCGSKNLACVQGGCAHRPCTKSSECDGHCVAGFCWNKPGYCYDTSLPPPP